MNSLPPLCLESIAHQAYAICKDIRERAQIAASLAIVGNMQTEYISHHLYDMIDEGSLKARNDALFLNTESRSKWHDIVQACISVNKADIQLEKLREVCKKIGTTTSGSKAKVMQTIELRRCIIDTLLEQPPLSPRKCQIRPSVRRLVAALKDPDVRITVTTAKIQYKLKEKDIVDLVCDERCNPYGQHKPPMRLYKVIDIIPIFNTQHGYKDDTTHWAFMNEEQLLEDQRKLKRMLNRTTFIEETLKKHNTTFDELKIVDNECHLSRIHSSNISRQDIEGYIEVLARRIINRKHLETELGKVGCKLRDDSRLCRNYIMCQQGNLKTIVDTMCEMKFFFDETNYAKNLKRLLDECFRDLREYGEYHYMSEDDINEVHCQASDNAKRVTIDEWCKKYPGGPSKAVKHPTLPYTLKEIIVHRFHIKQ